MSRWRASTWGDEIALEYGKGVRAYSNAMGPYRVYGSNGPVGWTSEPLAPGPGIILGRKGAYRGVRFSPEPFFVIDTAYYVVPKTTLDMRWLYYAMVHHKLGEIDDGSPIPSTTRAAVYVRHLEVPPPEEQRAIATILGALDEKIELNRRMNETLEAMARAIFKDWFVDFGPVRAKAAGQPPKFASDIVALFPNELDSMGRPTGWHQTSLGKLTTKIGSGATPKGGKQVYVESGVNFIRSQNIHDHRFSWDGLAKIGDHAAHRLRNVAVEINDVLINITGDSILRTCVVDPAALPARVSQHVAIIRARQGVPSRFLHLYLALESSKVMLLGNDAGGSRPAITKGHLEDFPLIQPSQSVLNAFQEMTAPGFDRVSHNDDESRILGQLRDLLLPTLISGEIRVKDAAKIVERVV